MSELNEALKDNWQEHEVLQALAKNKAPKYGRDDDQADEMAKKVMDLWCDLAWKHCTVLRGYCENGGSALQINMLDPAMLRDLIVQNLEQHPHKRPDFIRNAATFCDTDSIFKGDVGPLRTLSLFQFYQQENCRCQPGSTVSPNPLFH